MFIDLLAKRRGLPTPDYLARFVGHRNGGAQVVGGVEVPLALPGYSREVPPVSPDVVVALPLGVLFDAIAGKVKDVVRLFGLAITSIDPKIERVVAVLGEERGDCWPAPARLPSRRDAQGS